MDSVGSNQINSSAFAAKSGTSLLENNCEKCPIFRDYRNGVLKVGLDAREMEVLGDNLRELRASVEACVRDPK